MDRSGGPRGIETAWIVGVIIGLLVPTTGCRCGHHEDLGVGTRPAASSRTATNTDPPVSVELAEEAGNPGRLDFERTLISPNASLGGSFGMVLATDGRTLVVGQRDRDNRQRIFVYRCDTLDTPPIEIERPEDLSWGAAFGGTVAVSGDSLVIGAPNSGSPYERELLGEVYIYRQVDGKWERRQRIESNDTRPHHRAFFGRRVAMNGRWLAVSVTKYEDRNGAVYLYELRGNEWVFAQRLESPPEASTLLFAQSLALDERLLAVGAPNFINARNVIGEVYIYRRTEREWSLQQRIRGTGAIGAEFGDTLDIHGSHLIVGAPLYRDGTGRVFTYRLHGETWERSEELVQPSSRIHRFFGTAISIYGDLALVGSLGIDIAGHTEPGAANLYAFDGERWSHAGELTAPTPRAGDFFGGRVELSVRSFYITGRGVRHDETQETRGLVSIGRVE